MASFSPPDSRGDVPEQQPGAGSAYGSGESSAGTKSPLALGLGFLKGLGSSEKRANRDGQPAKRRGPKPDSKPALTRRQELNRQAQRTHRERKEVYIKSLEEQVMQLKEIYTGSIQEKNAVADENRQLKDLLKMHGIAYQGREHQALPTLPADYTQQSGSPIDSRSEGSYTYSRGFSPLSQPQSGLPDSYSYLPDQPSQQFRSQQSIGPEHLPQHTQLQQQQQQPQQGGLDHDQLGVDFVLALEAPCMEHLQELCVRSNQDLEPTPNGHALMMSCPPFSHIDNNPDVPYPCKMMDIPNSDLMTLLTLSQDLPLDGELTPVMALNIIRNHPRYNHLTYGDFEALKNDLRTKTRCYGFGAVLEEFELRDALQTVFTTKESLRGFFDTRT